MADNSNKHSKHSNGNSAGSGDGAGAGGDGAGGGAGGGDAAVKREHSAQPARNTDVLEEDDTFEEFEDRDYKLSGMHAELNVEWEDNWDDEVEGDDHFSRTLRAELEAQKGAGAGAE